MATVGGNLLQRTRCSYFQDVTKPCNKRQPGAGCPAREGDHRDLAILGHSERLRGHPPVGHGGRARRARRRSSTSRARRGPATVPMPGLHRLPGDEPERDTVLAPGELITAVELPPLPPSRPGRPTARCGTGRRSRSRWCRWRRPSTWRTAGWCATAGSRSAASRTCRGGRRAPRQALRGAPATADEFAAAADAELGRREPLRDNAFKVPLARNLMVGMLADLVEAA